MPSLPTNNDVKWAPNDAFRQYLPTKYDHLLEDSWYILKHFLCLTIKTIIVASCMSCTWNITAFILINYPQFYHEYHIGIVREVSRSVLWYSFIYLYLTITNNTIIYVMGSEYKDSFNNNKSEILKSSLIQSKHVFANTYPKKRVFITIVAVGFIINTTLGSIMNLYTWPDPRNLWICNYVFCSNLDAFSIYKSIVGFPLNFIICVTVNHIVFVLYRWKHIKRPKYTYVDFRPVGIQHSKANKNRTLNEISNEAYSFDSNVISREYFMYSICYGIIIFMVLLVTYMISNFKSKYEKDSFLSAVIVLTVETSIFRYLLKIIARNIDSLRCIMMYNYDMNADKIEKFLNQTHYAEYHEYKTSLEILSDSFIRCLYSICYRYLLIYDIPPMNKFLISQIYNFIMFLCYTIIRPSIYYKIKSDKLMLKSIMNNNNIPYYPIKFVLKYWLTNSNKNEWKKRIAIDNFIRIGLSGCGCIIIDIVLFLGKNKWKTDWNRAFTYNNISLIFDLIVYFILSELIYALLFGEPFVGVFLTFYLYHGIKFIIITSLVIGISLYLFGFIALFNINEHLITVH